MLTLFPPLLDLFTPHASLFPFIPPFTNRYYHVPNNNITYKQNREIAIFTIEKTSAQTWHIKKSFDLKQFTDFIPGVLSCSSANAKEPHLNFM